MGRLDQLVPMTEPEQLTEPENTESVQPSAEYREALLVLDDTSYLHVQPCDTGWDYTLYDVATMKQMDGGQLDGRIWAVPQRLAISARTWGWAASPSSMRRCP